MSRHPHRTAVQIGWPGVLRPPRGARYDTLQLYRSHHAGGVRLLWYAANFIAALARVRAAAPASVGRLLRLEAAAFDV